jgi:hypothetical protein
MRARAAVAWGALTAQLLGCAGQSIHAPRGPEPPPVRAAAQVITPSDGATEAELAQRGEHALLAQRWHEAADALETLYAAAKMTGDSWSVDTGAGKFTLPALMFDLALAYEGLEEREKARDLYHDVARRFGTTTEARAALIRAASIHAYLEEWPLLGQAGQTLLERNDLDDVDRLTALGARGLMKIEAGDDVAAMRDVQNGLDLVDQLGFGATGRLPVAAAQLRFALAEVRRVRSERITFTPVTADFLVKIETRCQGLLDAQAAYADAMRSVDPHWAAMSGYRVGEMYRVLHRDLMIIPPTAQAKSDAQKRLFFAMMHLRYRAFLDKGLEMMKRTVALGAKTNDASSWVKRAEGAQREMEVALTDEKAVIAAFPYSEAEVQKALDILEAKAQAGPRKVDQSP